MTDMVDKPKHYQVIGNTEAKDLIKAMLEVYVKDNPDATPWQISCAANIFKYRLRIGAKDDPTQELGKIRKYKELHDDDQQKEQQNGYLHKMRWFISRGWL